MFGITGTAFVLLTAAAPQGGEGRAGDLGRQVADYLSEPNYSALGRRLQGWRDLPAADRQRILRLLAARVGSGDRVPFTDPGGLTIPYRTGRGDLAPSAHGGVVRQDLFVAGGRAAWAIEGLIAGPGAEVSLPEINEGLTPAERADRAAAISRAVDLYGLVAGYLTEPDFLVLARTVGEWERLPAADRVRIVDLLVAHLRSLGKPGLTNYRGNVAIPYRLLTGDMERGPATQETPQDLFTAGGRAAWAIAQLIEVGAELPAIVPSLTRQELAARVAAISMCVSAYKAGVQHGSAPPAAGKPK